MKKLLFSMLLLAIGFSAMAQQSIQLRSVSKAECVKSDMTGLRASFSFSSIEAEDYESERGTFSWLSLPNTVRGGNEGEPQIPVINELIAVPFGATPRIEITSYSTTDYRLADYDMKTLVPRQPSLRKDKRPEEAPFVMNETAYQARGFRSEPMATVNVEGTMRGVRLGKMTIEPVSYDPSNNTIRVFNDIEVTVHFDGADAAATEKMLLDTYSPYFDIVYKSLFNSRAVTSVYDQHPDLYSTPVKMLVVTTSTYQSSTAYQNWLTWKKQKGIEVDEYIVTSSTSSSTIRSGIQSRYNANHPSFLVIVGDETVVPYYSLWDYGSTYGNAATDLEYASVDNDIYHDMFISRMPVASTTQLGYLVDKILMYEKYTMPDPSYLNATLLVAGWDSSNNWTNKVGKQTIQYANNNYFNSAHGITPYVHITTRTNMSGCYDEINQVGFINYTAHGDIQEWSDPEFTNSNVNSLTNTNKPFWAMGNCCLTANIKNAQNSQTCFGETMVRAQNKAAFGYIGSMVESYWFEDFYFGVGAFNAQNSTSNNPTLNGTSIGAYDAMFDDTGFNTLNAVPYIGNVSVSYAYAQNYTTSSGCSQEYYWRCYQCYGDGSVMPYLKVPAANNVSLSNNNQIPAGVSSYTVNADAGSYVSITVNNEIIGVAAVPANATSVAVPFTTTPVAGSTAMIVVTRNQRQPYINENVPIVSNTQHNITVNANPTAGGTVSGAGQYYADSQCTLTATPNRGYVFANWTLNNNVVSTDATYTFNVTADATYVANFTALTLHHSTYTPQQEHGTISVSPSEAYVGDIVTLTATPAAGYHLDHWDVNTVSKGNVTVTNNQFVMPDSDVTISATFRAGYDVTVPYLIGGTITPSANTADAGDVITLTVTPNSGYSFISWNVYQTSNPSNTVTVTNNRFTMPAYDVTVSAVFGTSQQVEVEVESTVSAGSGTSTTNGNYLPVRSNRNSANYSLTEQIYTVSELGAAGKITAVQFYNVGTSARTRTLQIYMVSTRKSTFDSANDWIQPASSNMVYSGSVTFTRNAWTTVTFTTPFVYDGVNNVALIVDDNTNSSQNGISCYTYSATSQSLYIYGSTNYNPTSITSNGTVGNVKNRVNFNITRTETQTQFLPLVCEEVPTNVAIEATPDAATVSWEGEADSYNLRYRVFSDNAFIYDFESADSWAVDAFSPCTTYDGDGTATYGVDGIDFDNEGYTGSFIAAQNGLSTNWAAHGGNAFGACIAANGATNNDWFILPARTIESGDIFGFWARSLTDSYGLERIKVGVYSGNGAFSSYIEGSASTYVEVPVDWTNYSYDLSSYAGQTIQLAINCVSNDAFALFIDDISITNASGSWDQTITNVTSPYTIAGLDDETLYEVQVVGVCDGIGESEGVGSSFTTLSWCTTPTPTSITNIAASSADLGWTGYQNSYNVRYRTPGGRVEYLYESFEAGMPSDWTTSGLASNSGVYSGAPNSGTYMYGFVSNSSSQYLILPEIDITEAGSVFAFYHLAYGGNVTMRIGYSSTTTATSAFTWGSSQTVASGSAYDMYYEEIPVGTKYIGIQVTNIAGSYYLLDDVMVYGPYVEPGEYHYANNVTSPAHITGLAPDTEYEWQVQGVNCDGNGTPTDWSTEAYFITPSACDTPDGLSATDITTTSAVLSWTESLDDYNLRYGTPETKFFYDFESVTPYAVDDFSPCTTYDGDGSTTGGIQDVSFDNQGYTGSFIAFQSGMAGGLEAHGGNAFGACFYATTPANNDWFILPAIAIGTGDVFSFWALGYSSQYPESFKVGVYNGNGGFSSYLAGSASASITPSTSWQQYSYDLSSYNGQTIQLAIQCVSDDAFIFAIDDIFVGNPHWNTPISVTGGSYTLENLTPGTEYAWQVQGANCDNNGTPTDWSSTANFTTIPVFTKVIAAYGNSEKGGYYLIASPLANVAPTAVNGMITDNLGNTATTSTSTYDLYSFDQAQTLEWQNYRNEAFDLVNGQGYLYASKEGTTLSITGVPSTNDQVTLTKTANAEFEGWNLVGNPFGQTAYLSRAFYSMQNAGGFTANTEGGSIGLMEGVFVIAETDGEQLTFTTTAPNKVSQLNLNLTQGNSLMDRAIVRFDEGSQLPKFQFRKGSTKVYIPQEGKDYAVVRSEGIGVMPVNFKAENNGTYTLSFTTEEVSFAYLHLIDNMTGIDVDLLATPSYSFNAKTTDYESRFKLVFATGSSNDDTFAFFSNGSFVINNEGEATLQVIDVNGRILKSESINGCANVSVNAAQGIYMLRLVNGDNVKVQKVVVK